MSCFTEPEDTITLPETEAEHEYQQIEVVDAASGAENQESGKTTACENESKNRASSAHNSPNVGPETHHHLNMTPFTKLSTLDVRQERHNNNTVSEDAKYSCLPRKDVLDMSSLTKTRKQSTQSLISQKSQQSASYTLSSSLGDNMSVLSDPDSYQELSQPSTVIHVLSGKTNQMALEGSHGSESDGIKSNTKHSANLLRSTSQHHVSTQGSNTSSSAASKNSHKTLHQLRHCSVDLTDTLCKDQMMDRSKPPAVVFPPLTIELPETKPTSWRYEHHVSVKKDTRLHLNDSPYIITTLDPPIKRSSPKHHNTSTSPEPCPTDIPPLVVNFDSEDSVSEDDTVYEFDDSYWSTADDNTSLYMADSDTSSLYSSVGEIYSMFVTEPDALIYVYRPPPRPRDHGPHRSSNLSYRFPTYAITRWVSI